MAFVIIVAKPLVECTYLLEGDGPCALIAYDELLKCKIWFDTNFEHLTFPYLLQEIDVAVQVLSPISFDNNNEAATDNLKNHVREAIRPAINYFNNKIFGELAKDILIYKILRYCNPFSIKRFNYNINLIELRQDLESLEHFTNLEINSIITEAPTYLLYCEQFNPIVTTGREELDQILTFWSLNKNQLPSMVLFVAYGYCFAPSSASVERVFSMLKSSFGSLQNLALEDYIATSVMFQYNNR